MSKTISPLMHVPFNINHMLHYTPRELNINHMLHYTPRELNINHMLHYTPRELNVNKQEETQTDICC